MFEVEFWHWMALGVALAAIETLVPGAFFLWLGIAAIVTGAVKLFFAGMGLEGQAIIFAVCAVVSTVIWLILWRRRPIVTDRPDLNMRGERMIGRRLTLDEPITNGEGSVKVGDSMWRVRGPDFVRGTQVKVVNVEGTVLIVDKA
ncbi:MAG: NfeD family protein [Rhodospirillaceae bacterium]|nr:NfeD family protein [Rhodospirillaceae bacterium]